MWRVRRDNGANGKRGSSRPSARQTTGTIRITQCPSGIPVVCPHSDASYGKTDSCLSTSNLLRPFSDRWLVQTSKSLRRLAADHGALHTGGLPPNYLFHPLANFDSLTDLSVLLAGSDGTPYADGVYHLELNIPQTYPTTPPTANFRTKIFHPNVDPTTGSVCVDTLKRDWRPDLTLRDVLVTIYCLLAYPNAASALNEEAGMLIVEDYAAFERRASLWTKMYAAVPAELRHEVDEAKRRGEAPVKTSADGTVKVTKPRRRKAEGLFPLDPDAAENRNQVGATSSKSADSLFTPEPANNPILPPPRGLGLKFDSLYESDATAFDDTPTQAAPPPIMRRVRKRYLPNTTPSETSSFASSSFTQLPATPTPTIKEPETKRVRLSSDEELRAPILSISKAEAGSAATREAEHPWLNWHETIAFVAESPTSRESRERYERARMKAAGGCVKKYNSGAFGPRRGIMRL